MPLKGKRARLALKRKQSSDATPHKAPRQPEGQAQDVRFAGWPAKLLAAIDSLPQQY
jgi:hypothetical protein